MTEVHSLEMLHEPLLEFGYGQCVEDPRDGLTLFGPLDPAVAAGVRYGVIGTDEGIRDFAVWVESLQRPVVKQRSSVGHPPFPGFEAAFRTSLLTDPVATIAVPDAELRRTAFQDDRHARVFRTVDCFAQRLLEEQREDGAPVDLWFVVIPDYIKENCRPQSSIVHNARTASNLRVGYRHARRNRETNFLFQGMAHDAKVYAFEPNFHNQLKARLLAARIVSQIVVQSTIAPQRAPAQRTREAISGMASGIAWRLSTGVYYKAGGRPWKGANVRRGVCYLGIVFKQVDAADPRNACCAAQVFLDSGDGVVFKGAVGPWYNPTRGDFHLSYDAAREVIELALRSYGRAAGGTQAQPEELFIHGKVRFNDEEWQGFLDAAGPRTQVSGICIRATGQDVERLKLYGPGRIPPLRGLAYVVDERQSYLWTKGFVPRLRTYPGIEVPNPIVIELVKGDADMRQVLRDVLALTKLNYNTCRHSDGTPVTLRFADAVGEILTAGPMEGLPPLPFKHYV